jgi:hypothetical protein
LKQIKVIIGTNQGIIETNQSNYWNKSKELLKQIKGIIGTNQRNY